MSKTLVRELGQLQRVRNRGELTAEEHDRARAFIIAAHGRLDAPAPARRGGRRAAVVSGSLLALTVGGSMLLRLAA